MPAGDKFVSILQFLEDQSTDSESFLLGFISGGIVMALGLAPVVDDVRRIFANKDATIQQLSDRLAVANANAITPSDQAAFADLQTAIATENALPPIP